MTAKLNLKTYFATFLISPIFYRMMWKRKVKPKINQMKAKPKQTTKKPHDFFLCSFNCTDLPNFKSLLHYLYIKFSSPRKPPAITIKRFLRNYTRFDHFAMNFKQKNITKCLRILSLSFSFDIK